jgi:transcriptional regulator with XRE-family HTH domain
MAKPKAKSTVSSVGDYIRAQRQMANLSLRKMSEQSGISRSVLEEIENGFRNPTATIMQSIARGLRLSAETLQLQAGVIDPVDADEVDVVREIRRDPNLTERQREVLVDVYRALCAANHAPKRR